MKQVYIRVGNSEETKRVIIIGEEQSMGERDQSGYRPNKGSTFKHLVESDPYSGSKGLTYIHMTPNINLDTPLYKRDYDVHQYVKRHCKDLVTWDGEADEGTVRSREAFIVNDGLNVESVAQEIYLRLEREIHRRILPAAVFSKVTDEVKKNIEKEYHLDDLRDAIKTMKQLVGILKHMKK